MDLGKHVNVRLEPKDEYTHPIEAASNFNESMYLNAFDHGTRAGGWFRVGNRPNEGHSEMSCCLYLPDGRVAFMFARPAQTRNERFEAAGLSIEVLEPFRSLRVRYAGKLCVLRDPQEMLDPKRAFANNPMVDATVDFVFEGVSPMYGGEVVDDEGRALPENPDEAFARAHYEQHMAARGTFVVGGEAFTIDGLGLRDHSWGPRYWQNLYYYRWLPMSFSREFALNVSLVNLASGKQHVWGMVLRDGVYEHVESASLESHYDDAKQAKSQTLTLSTASHSYTVHGKALATIPLRNRRTTDSGEHRVTRITEAFSEFRCGDFVGFGMAEYLDQMVEGVPVGLAP